MNTTDGIDVPDAAARGLGLASGATEPTGWTVLAVFNQAQPEVAQVPVLVALESPSGATVLLDGLPIADSTVPL